MQPLFHDGGKEWSCCKQRSHDFSLFLDIPGCRTGKHTTEKPETKAAPSPNKPIVSPTVVAGMDAIKGTCLRCRHGFFCSEHGSKVETAVRITSSKLYSEEKPLDSIERPAVQPAKVIDLNAAQICKNKGCGKTFSERDNNETACSYHPGPAVFHDRLRGWACCDVHVKEFDEFLTIPPCSKGWHNANP
eukprot:c22320_g1_i1 orf=667-1233(+)